MTNQIKKLGTKNTLTKDEFKLYYRKSSYIKKKNIYQVEREFGKEEWYSLFKRIKKIKKNITINDVEKVYNNFKKKIIFYDKGSFYLGSVKYVISRYNKLYKKIIISFIRKDTTGIVELGAGYGSKIFHLANNLNLNKEKFFFAGELTKNGREIMKIIHSKKKVNIFKCNLLDKYLKKKIPFNSIIFTSYALHYLPKLKKNFYLYYKKIKPTAVIHFEPIYETHKSNTLYGNICKNYIHKNDYCKNLLSTLKQLQKEKKIKIIYFKKNTFGSNPLLPISIIAWKFCSN